MRVRTLILLLVAIVLAGGTAMLARAWLSAQKSHAVAEAAPIAVPPPLNAVLVAHHPIARGEILKGSDFAWEPWPNSGIDKSYIKKGTRSPDSFAGWVARNPISPGDPITMDKIVAPGSRGFLAAVLRPGMRAVSVEVNATTGISGFVFPGDMVDILITYPVPSTARPGTAAAQYQHRASETVLRDIRVLGIDQRLQTKNGQAVLAKTATLEVTPKQSEIIALASDMGKLSLSLRSLANAPVAAGAKGATPVSDSPAALSGVSYTLDDQISSLLPKPLLGKEEIHSDTVTILRGNGKSSESFGAKDASRGS